MIMTRFNTLPDKYKDKIGYEIKKPEGNNDKLIIYGELPTMNQIINQAKGHWDKYRRMKEEIDNTVAWHAHEQKIKFYESVELVITYYMKNKRCDPDNIISSKKFILDGLRKAGVIEDDGWEQIKGFTEEWKVDKNNPRIEILFKEV